MNVLVEEQCLRDIAESIRNKSGLTKTYKPREMSVAIDNLQTGGSGCLVKIEQSANQTITATYKGKTYTDDFFVLIGESFQTSITADKYYTAGTVNYKGTPLHGDITVRATQATEARKYRVTIVQSANQTITATYDGRTYTSTFYAYEGSRITVSIQAGSGYEAGILSHTVISSLSYDVTVRATEATPAGKSYNDRTFAIVSGNSYQKSCRFTDDGETFTIKILGGIATIYDNNDFVAFLKRTEETYFDYWGTRICTFRKRFEADKTDYNMLKNFSNGTELTVKVVES